HDPGPERARLHTRQRYLSVPAGPSGHQPSDGARTGTRHAANRNVAMLAGRGADVRGAAAGTLFSVGRLDPHGVWRRGSGLFYRLRRKDRFQRTYAEECTGGAAVRTRAGWQRSGRTWSKGWGALVEFPSRRPGLREPQGQDAAKGHGRPEK